MSAGIGGRKMNKVMACMNINSKCDIHYYLVSFQLGFSGGY